MNSSLRNWLDRQEKDQWKPPDYSASGTHGPDPTDATKCICGHQFTVVPNHAAWNKHKFGPK